VRVLHVDSGREFRGGQNQVRLLARELARESSVEQRLVTRRGSELARRATAEGVAVREIPWGLGLDPRAWWRLVVEALAWPPDVIHAHNNHAVTVAVWARRFLGLVGTPPRVLVRFAPDARVADITALLDSYQASIVDGAKGGLFQLQFGNKAMTKDEIANLMSRLQGEKIVNLAVAAQ